MNTCNSNAMRTLVDPFTGCDNKPVSTAILNLWLKAYELREEYEYCEIILTEIKRRELSEQLTDKNQTK